MPIFEYRCRACGSDFELLVHSGTRVACPQCGSARAQKKFSHFASHVKRPETALPPCHTGGAGCDMGKCGSGFCGVS